MKNLTFPHFVLSRVEAVFFAVTGGIPETSEIEKADRPYERARDVAKKAVAQCAAVSGTLSLPVGPLGMLTILPDLALVWKKEVARNAVELFSGEKLPARHSKRNFPRAEQMFEASAIKEIDSKVL